MSEDTIQSRYKNGMLKSRTDDPEMKQLVEDAATGFVATVDRMGPQAVQDWEIDELLDWTVSLNFDEYVCARFAWSQQIDL